MSTTFRTGYAYVQNCFAGIIAETDSGYVFTYDKDYLQNAEAAKISLTLPLRAEPYESPVLFPFFDGLIPEGWLLEAAVRNWKIDRNDRFGLLLSVCNDCVGDVSIRRTLDE